MLRNKKILTAIISVVIIFTFSYLVIARTVHPQAAVNPAVQAVAKENNTLEITFSDQPADTREQPDRHNSIIVDRATVCLGIKDRLPIQETQQANVNCGKVYCWAMLLNGQGKKVRYIWYLGEKVSASSWLSITSNRFRTWCPKNIDSKSTGPARVDIVDEQGRILKSIDFEIIPARKSGMHLRYS